MIFNCKLTKVNKRFFIILGVIILTAFLGIGFYILNKKKTQTSISYHHSVEIKSEKDFLVQMIYHHQEAVDAAQKVLERGGTIKEVREIASNIITTQKDEIELMKNLYRQWFKEDLPSQNVYHPMMRPLDNLSGKELDKQFLEDMILHHQGAIKMAEEIKRFTNKPEIQQIIETIIKIQSEEIKKIERILKENFN
jgi:uncharacterized protein (DUF305 family)